jgi:itaconyl-CoA hydratase
MAIRKYWEEYQVGEVLESPSITITEAHLVTWAGLTMDFYPLHMDKEYAKTTVMKERVAHGPMIFGMSVGLMSLKHWMEYDSIIAWLGSDIKIMKPVHIGDTIHVVSEVAEKRETSKPHQGIQKWLYKIINQNDEVVMENMMTFMMYRKPLKESE